jgi:hypothetical protein
MLERIPARDPDDESSTDDGSTDDDESHLSTRESSIYPRPAPQRHWCYCNRRTKQTVGTATAVPSTVALHVM